MINPTTNKEKFENLIEQMYNNAAIAYQKTEEFRLNNEKMERMEADCRIKFNPSDSEFVIGCFDTMIGNCSQRELYIYRKGLLNCVGLLKWMGVLA